ncbi:DNA photolyase, FAD-binding/Cryptochrome [Sphaerosporella brunnea]|uniref:DNA photolyase, FAD-binding/Cryptochrome n=1 Tax=Sphaerosporella brunnea TaxID=1250544 RepID=A0A5J5F873_9PEZI|nr:DNA photolyase, FAD-binding/Cryptochrome [Sphaerosporella brunnea]
MPPKRKLATVAAAAAAPQPKKKLQTALPTAAAEANYDEGIVDPKYYPPVLSNARCAAYVSGELPKPIDKLTATLCSSTHTVETGKAVVHWFRTDLRVDDNTGLSLAGKLGKPLIGLYIVSPQDWEAHIVSPARVDFILRSLEMLKQDLERLEIPLWVEVAQNRNDIPRRAVELCHQWGANHLFANMEYEVDELRRDAKVVQLARTKGMEVQVVHDTCVVPPGELVTKAGKQSTGKAFAVYKPWYKAFLARVAEKPSLLKQHPPPPANPLSTRTHFAPLFTCLIPAAPENKSLTPSETTTVHTLFPAGSHTALSLLDTFIAQRSRAYATDRNLPAKPGTSMLSPHFSAGTISARTAICRARSANAEKLSGGQQGLDTWISEVAWRDFYKHVLAAFPYICMNKPFKPALASISWIHGAEATTRFTAWTSGHTGYPLIDASMRHLQAEKFMPNRLRMVVASFLCKDLHLDWRRGEQYFSSQLIDGDFASNNGGWGFASSTGVDPQPYFRVFNPTLQGEKWDPDGEYVRRWVPELKDVDAKQIHNPSAEVRKRTGYPPQIVQHDVARKRVVEMYKEGIERGKSD